MGVTQKGGVMEQKKMVSIGEAASQCGISVRRVRYLSDQGYIKKPFKSISGDICYRLYSHDHIKQIKRIKAFQDEGYTLKAAAQKANE